MRLAHRKLVSDSRSRVLLLRIAVLLIVGPGAGTRILGQEPAKPARRGGVSFTGRVVDAETGKPVTGASVVVERLLTGILASDWPAWTGKSTLKSDGDGRFVLDFPPEQVAERRLSISFEVGRADYIPRKSSTPLSLVEITASRNGRDRPVFETIKLQKGVEYSGRIVDPKGRPAAGAGVELAQWGEDGNPSDHFVDETKTTTGLDGRFRLRMPKTRQLAIYVTPADHAPFQQFWGADEPEKQPELWAPTDLGQLVLAAGIRLSGRLIDVQGRPIAGQLITAQSIYSRFERSAKTNADGRFTFAPLRQGNYILLGQGQLRGANLDPTARAIATQGTVFEPTKVYLRDGIVPDCVELRELPTVQIEIRFVDSRDRPVRGSFVGLWGALPANNNQPAPQEAIFEGDGLAATINGAEQEDKSRDFQWAAHLVADAAGRLVLRAPKGLRDAQIVTLPPDETIAITSRFGEGKPVKTSSAGQLEELKTDLRGVTFVYHRAPMIMATVKTEDGEEPVVNTQVAGQFRSDGEEYEASFVEQADVRYRSQNLLPGREYEVTAWATGFVPNRLHRLKLQEGASVDLNLTLKRQPKPVGEGDIAPPFVIKTLAGSTLALGDLRGKFVLLHFWSPLDDNCIQELPHIKAVRDRFGSDDRFAMIGLCLVSDPVEAAKLIREKHLEWPQAILRDRTADWIVIAYEAGDLPKSFLIGPDGKLVAKNLVGDNVADAVAKALGLK